MLDSFDVKKNLSKKVSAELVANHFDKEGCKALSDLKPPVNRVVINTALRFCEIVEVATEEVATVDGATGDVATEKGATQDGATENGATDGATEGAIKTPKEACSLACGGKAYQSQAHDDDDTTFPVMGCVAACPWISYLEH
jgi:hypothetical protein